MAPKAYISITSLSSSLFCGLCFLPCLLCFLNLPLPSEAHCFPWAVLPIHRPLYTGDATAKAPEPLALTYLTLPPDVP